MSPLNPDLMSTKERLAEVTRLSKANRAAALAEWRELGAA